MKLMRVTVKKNERGLLLRNGDFDRVLPPAATGCLTAGVDVRVETRAGPTCLYPRPGGLPAGPRSPRWWRAVRARRAGREGRGRPALRGRVLGSSCCRPPRAACTGGLRGARGGDRCRRRRRAARRPGPAPDASLPAPVAGLAGVLQVQVSERGEAQREREIEAKSKVYDSPLRHERERGQAFISGQAWRQMNAGLEAPRKMWQNEGLSPTPQLTDEQKNIDGWYGSPVSVKQFPKSYPLSRDGDTTHCSYTRTYCVDELLRSRRDGALLTRSTPAST